VSLDAHGAFLKFQRQQQQQQARATQCIRLNQGRTWHEQAAAKRQGTTSVRVLSPSCCRLAAAVYITFKGVAFSLRSILSNLPSLQGVLSLTAQQVAHHS
jgi:hypothetical protein